MEAQTPMIRQYLEIKRKHPGTLLFFRLGDFYEMFFEDAVEAARELEITLTSRNTDKSGRPIPMCGVPHHSVNTYLIRLVKKGYKVAICEQVEDPRKAKGIVAREVTRIVTPGTTIEEGMLDSRENNFIASLATSGDRVGSSFLDLSTGEFWLSQVESQQGWEEIRQTLTHFHPSEIILPEEEQSKLLSHLPKECRADLVESPQPDWIFHGDYSLRLLLDHFKVATLESFGLNGERAAISAAGALLYYVKQTQKTDLSHITGLRYLHPGHYLKLDDSTIRNLELVRGSDGNRRWTLIGAMDLTRTGMGARLLRAWMLRPSLDLDEIESRLEAVEELQTSLLKMGRMSRFFKSICDLERLLGRVTLATAHPRDLIAMKDSLLALPQLVNLLRGYRSSLLSAQIDLLEDVAERLEAGIDPQAPVSVSEGRVIRPGYNAQLDQLREIAASGKSYIAQLEAKERERTGIQKLRVRYNKVFGYFIEITKSQLHLAPPDYFRKQTLVNVERFVTPELKEYEEKVVGAEEQIVEMEKQLFGQLRLEVAGEAARIQRTARTLGQLDVLLAFAQAAQKHHYVRPRLDHSRELVIEGGRHPVLELQGSEPFVPNDLTCNTGADQLLILTGPNMGGKSTYLRQNALIVILAQMGSFVPAEKARIGLVDQIFTRVGASDNLSRGRSTFMVEMIETAHILNTATPRSFILLDEVGRGTATFDGLSLAWSVAEYLLTETSRRARTLFATHYQELTKLDKLYEGVKNCRVTVRESNGQIIFFHRVRPGVAARSYGIEVARLAGVPSPVLQRARQILSRLERKELNLSGRRRSSSTHGALEELQKALF
ncbi:MAG: DNA mismatch repair protein MutS [Acidobacteriota bacterium]